MLATSFSASCIRARLTSRLLGQQLAAVAAAAQRLGHQVAAVSAARRVAIVVALLAAIVLARGLMSAVGVCGRGAWRRPRRCGSRCSSFACCRAALSPGAPPCELCGRLPPPQLQLQLARRRQLQRSCGHVPWLSSLLFCYVLLFHVVGARAAPPGCAAGGCYVGCSTCVAESAAAALAVGAGVCQLCGWGGADTFRKLQKNGNSGKAKVIQCGDGVFRCLGRCVQSCCGGHRGGAAW